MAKQEQVSLEQVRRVAELANLKLTAEEEPRMQRDLSAILGRVAQLNELDTAGVEAMSQVGEVLKDGFFVAGEDLRKDFVRNSLDRGEVLQASPESDDRFFKVPKVIER